MKGPCGLIGSYYPVDLAFGQCDQADRRATAAEWVGNGTASCARSLECLANVPSGDDSLKPTTDCMLQSKPAVAGALSAAFSCMSSAENPQLDCAAELEACRTR